MYVLQLTDGQLRVLEEALQAYLEEFGHDEGETERLIKTVIARVQSARVDVLDASQA